MRSTETRAILAELEGLGSAENRAGMARFGINTEQAYGVSIAQIRPLARRLKPDHELALGLWASGIHEARLLAAFIDDPKQVDAGQMEAWVVDFDSWDLCDQVCMKLFVKTPYAEDKIKAWIVDDREFVRRAGFALLAAYAVHGKKIPDKRFVSFLDMIEKHADDPRNFVRKAVNWALRQIGKRSMTLHAPALALAERLAASPDKTERWIGKDAVKELTDPIQLERIAAKSVRKP